MSLTTYAGLIAAIGDNLERSDTASLAVDWIALCEARVSRELRINQMLTRSTATLTSEWGSVPTDFAAPKSMRRTTGEKLLLRFLTAEQMADQQEVQITGPTEAYARVGAEFWFYPPPTAGDVVELIYYAKIPPLTVANTTNWLLTQAPDVYLRGSLLEAGLYYRDEEMAKAQSALFADALTTLEAADRRDAMSANINPSPSAYPI